MQNSENNLKENMVRNLVILGSGGFAREVAWLVSDINKEQKETWNVVGFWGNQPELVGKLIDGIPVINQIHLQKYLPNLYAVTAIGNPKIKERAVVDAENLNCQFATLIHPSVIYDKNTVKIGDGTIIGAGSILTVNVTLGSHVVINLDCTIGHDCVIEDFATLSPGCHLSGYSVLKKGCFLGTGSATVEKHEIGQDAIIGAGAIVVKDIPANVTAVGVPAKLKL